MKAYDIVISENISGPAVDALSERFKVLRLPELWKSPRELAEHIQGAKALIVRNQTKVDAALLDAANELIVVGRAGAGLDNVDVIHATNLGILVTSTPDQNAISVAELALGLMLSLARKLPEADVDTKAGNWNRHAFLGMELYGKTLGIVGAGKIGYLTARRAQAFGMKILAHDPFLSPDNVLLSELNAELLGLTELLERSDFVSCHLPANEQTIGMINREFLRKMKLSAYLINTSRGEIIVEEDLAEALRLNIIAGAALDVRSKEPPSPDHLKGLPNLILTPHIAAFTHEAQARVSRTICEDVARVLDGQSAQNAVNSPKPLKKPVPS